MTARDHRPATQWREPTNAPTLRDLVFLVDAGGALYPAAASGDIRLREDDDGALFPTDDTARSAARMRATETAGVARSSEVY